MPERASSQRSLRWDRILRKKTVLEKGGIVSTAPTFTKVLGLALANADGKPFTELLQR